MKQTLPCHSKCYKALCVNWTPYQDVKTEQRCAQTQKSPRSSIRKKETRSYLKCRYTITTKTAKTRQVRPLQYRCAFRVLLFTLETSNKHSVCTRCTQFVTYTHKHGTCTLHCLSSCNRTNLLSLKSSKNETSTTPHEHSQCLSRVYRRSRTQQVNPVTVETPILSVPPRHCEKQQQYVSPIRSIMLRARVQHAAFLKTGSLQASTQICYFTPT